MSAISIGAICILAWQMDIDVPEFHDQSFTEYCSTPLFRQLALTGNFARLYRNAFGSLNVTDVPSIMAGLDHKATGTAGHGAAMALAVIMVIVVALRVYTRIFLLTGKLRPEDWLTLAASALTCVVEGLNWIVQTEGGAGKHFYDVSQRENHTILKYTTVLMTIYNLAMLLTKMSFLVVYASLYFTSSRKFRWACYLTACFIVIGHLVFIFYSIFGCSPVDFWNDLDNVWTDCLHTNVGEIASSSYNVATDIVILLLPLTIVLRMENLSIRDKMGLIALFVLGASVCVTSFVRIPLIQGYQLAPDWSPYASNLFFLYTIEPILAIIASSLPTLRLLFLSWRNSYRENRDHEVLSVNELNVEATRTIERLAGVRSIISRARRAGFGGSLSIGGSRRTERSRSPSLKGSEFSESLANSKASSSLKSDLGKSIVAVDVLERAMRNIPEEDF